MSQYVRYQHKRILLLALVFVLASITPLIIRRPEELTSLRGIGLLVVSAASVVSVLSYEKIGSAIYAVMAALEKKEYSEKEILKFYDIKWIKVDGDIVFVKTRRGKLLGYAVIRISPFPFPFQHLPEKDKERYRNGWLRVIEGLDFNCTLRVENRLFNVQAFTEAMRKRADNVDSRVKEKLSRILE